MQYRLSLYLGGVALLVLGSCLVYTAGSLQQLLQQAHDKQQQMNATRAADGGEGQDSNGTGVGQDSNGTGEGQGSDGTGVATTLTGTEEAPRSNSTEEASGGVAEKLDAAESVTAMAADSPSVTVTAETAGPSVTVTAAGGDSSQTAPARPQTGDYDWLWWLAA